MISRDSAPRISTHGWRIDVPDDELCRRSVDPLRPGRCSPDCGPVLLVAILQSFHRVEQGAGSVNWSEACRFKRPSYFLNCVFFIACGRQFSSLSRESDCPGHNCPLRRICFRRCALCCSVRRLKGAYCPSAKIVPRIPMETGCAEATRRARLRCITTTPSPPAC
jgi:hypothetical protein